MIVRIWLVAAAEPDNIDLIYLKKDKKENKLAFENFSKFVFQMFNVPWQNIILMETLRSLLNSR